MLFSQLATDTCLFHLGQIIHEQLAFKMIYFMLYADRQDAGCSEAERFATDVLRFDPNAFRAAYSLIDIRYRQAAFFHFFVAATCNDDRINECRRR